MSKPPSPNGPNGRSASGRGPSGKFKAGNAGGPGNPHARQVGALRSAMLEAVSPADMRAIVAKLVSEAKKGNIPAAREIIERTLGKPVEFDLLERLARLEALAGREEP